MKANYVRKVYELVEGSTDDHHYRAEIRHNGQPMVTFERPTMKEVHESLENAGYERCDSHGNPL